MTNAEQEPPAVARLREFARASLPLESTEIEAQDAEQVIEYIDQLRERQESRDMADIEAREREEMSRE